jgi:hypothetical protein
MSADAVVLAALSLRDLTWGDPETRPTLRATLFPHDTPADAEDMAGGQSNCATAAMAALRIAEVDGRVRQWRGKPSCDPLREPYAKRYDAIQYLRELARQRGVLRLPKEGERPDLGSGCVVMVGGDDGLPPERRTRGGAAHVLLIVSDDGDTIEGGQLDAKNPKPSPKNCTAIRAKKREVYHRPGRGWWLRTAGETGEGRQIQWWMQAGDLPCLPSEGHSPEA